MAVTKQPQNFLALCYQYEILCIYLSFFRLEYVNPTLTEAKKCLHTVSSLEIIYLK